MNEPRTAEELDDPFADVKPLRLPSMLATAEGKELRELGYIAIVPVGWTDLERLATPSSPKSFTSSGEQS